MCSAPPTQGRSSNSGPSATSGSPASIPIESGGTLYLPGIDDTVEAIAASTGSISWTSSLADRPLIGSLAVAGSFVYVETNAGLTALDRGTGAVAWEVDEGELFAGPAVAGGDVYVTGNAGHLLDVDRRSGSVIWTGPLMPNSVPAVADGRVFSTTVPLHLVAFDAGTGALDWDVRPKNPGIQATDPVVADGLLFVTADADGGMYAFKPASGAVAWRLEQPVGFGSPVAANGLLYMVDGNSLSAIDDATGTIAWQLTLMDAPATRLAVANGVLYYGFAGGIALIDSTTGQFLRTIQLRGRWQSGSMPIVADGMVFAITQLLRPPRTLVSAFGLPSAP